ncbi:MAG: 3-coathanger stack domain-containing protein, partial [Bacteroidia bacterium]
SNQTSTLSLGPENSYVPNPPGLVLWAMAHLCHVILYDYPELCSTPLPGNLLEPNTSNYPYTNGIATYGLFADWLARRCVESLDWYLQTYWIGPTEGFRDEYNDDFGAAINQQAPFAAAFFYLGHLTNIAPCFAYQGFYSGLASYIDRAAQMAKLFTSYVNIYKDNSSCEVNLTCFSKPVFNFDLSKNSYWWFTTGWGYPKNKLKCNKKRVKCSEYFNISSEKYHIEDISHGIRTLIYPLLCYKYNFISGGTPFFNTSDMFRFRNTFVNSIWNGDLNSPQFFYSVKGSGYNNLISSSTCTSCNDTYFQWIPMAWMPFYKYDYLASNTTTYDVIKKHFSNLLLNYGLGNFVNGEKVWGIAHIASAQWDKECTDLTLYNRKLTYNQDIYAKKTLTIAPQQEDCYHSLNDNSLADPIITENKFIIEPGVTCTMKAGERIVLKAGFHAKAGSNFRAYIDPSLCY